jgi:hypothetical protein
LTQFGFGLGGVEVGTQALAREAPLARPLPPPSQLSRLRAETLRLAWVLGQERPQRPPAGMEQRLSQVLPVGLKGLGEESKRSMGLV